MATATATAGLLLAPPANAEARYIVNVRNAALIRADICLLTSTSGNGRASCAVTSYNQTAHLNAPYTPHDFVWLDINVIAGTDHKHIDISGYDTCYIDGTTADGKVRCRSAQFGGPWRVVRSW